MVLDAMQVALRVVLVVLGVVVVVLGARFHEVLLL